MSYTPLSFGSGGNVTFGSTGSQITATAPAGGGGGGVALSAGTVAITSGTAVFSNANGVTFGANGQTVTASHNGITSQSVQAYSGANGSATFQTLSFANSNGVSFSTGTQGLFASHNGLTSQSNQAFSASGGSSAFQTLNFANSNGLTFSNNAGSVVASYTVPSTAGLLSAVRLSAGTSSANLSALTLSNANGVSFGLNGSVVTASHNGLTTQSGQAVSAANGSSTFQTLSLVNSNGVSFSTTAGGLVASYALGVTAGTDSVNLRGIEFNGGGGVDFGLVGSTITAAYSQTKPTVGVSGDASLAYVGDIIRFASSNDIRWPIGTNGSVVAQPVPQWFAVGNTTNASSAQVTGLRMSVSGAGVASVGLAGGVVIVSVPAGGGGITNVNVSAGTTSQNLSAITFGNGGGVSFGLAGSVITASAPAGGGGGGATVSMYPALPHAWATSSMYGGASTTTAGGFRSTHSFYIAPLVLDAAVTFNNVEVMISAQNASGTGTGSHRNVLGIYTRNGNTLSKLTQFAFNAIRSFSSITAQTLSFWAGDFAGSTAASTSRISGNVSASITGARRVAFNATSSATSLSAGQYFIAHAYNRHLTGPSTGEMGSAWRYSVSQFTGGIGFSNTTGPAYCECNGIASTVLTSPIQFGWDAPPSISLGAITATGGTSRNQWPLVILRSVTA